MRTVCLSACGTVIGILIFCVLAENNTAGIGDTIRMIVRG